MNSNIPPFVPQKRLPRSQPPYSLQVGPDDDYTPVTEAQQSSAKHPKTELLVPPPRKQLAAPARPAVSRGGTRTSRTACEFELDRLGRILICDPDLLQKAAELFQFETCYEYPYRNPIPILLAAQAMLAEGWPEDPSDFRNCLVSSLSGLPLRADIQINPDMTDLVDRYQSAGEAIRNARVDENSASSGQGLVETFLVSCTFAAYEQIRSARSGPAYNDSQDLCDRISEIRIKLSPGFIDEAPPSSAEAFKPFPVDLLPDPVSAFVNEIASCNLCDPAMVAIPVLTMLGAAIGTTRQISPKPGWEEFPIIWGVVIAESGTCKTPVFSAVGKPLYQAQQAADAQFQLAQKHYDAAMRGHRHAAANDEKSGRPPRQPIYRHFFTSDSTVEAMAKMLSTSPRGLLIYKDELSDMIGSLNAYKRNSNDAAKLLEWFNGGCSKLDRKTSGTTVIPRAAVWITGAIQPYVFRKCFPDDQAENGFLARFLLAYPPRISQGWSDDFVSLETSNSWKQIISGLRQLDFVRTQIAGFPQREDPQVLNLDPEAQKIFADFCRSNDGEIQAEPGAHLRAALSKMRGYTAKFALIDHCVRGLAVDGSAEPGGASCTTVSVDSVDRAIKLATWFSNEARRIYSMRVEMASTEDQERIDLLAFIKRKGGSVTARDIAGNFSRFHKNSKLAEQELNALVDEGLGTWQLRMASHNGGRMTNKFILRTSVE